MPEQENEQKQKKCCSLPQAIKAAAVFVGTVGFYLFLSPWIKGTGLEPYPPQPLFTEREEENKEEKKVTFQEHFLPPANRHTTRQLLPSHNTAKSV